MKRAVSTAYYAMFHTLCRNCADCLIGTSAAQRSMPAWRQAYRALEHQYAKKQCRRTDVISKFPKDIEDFANLFQELQVDRHAADYDPHSRFSKPDVLATIGAAEKAISGFQRSPIKDRRAFAAWVTMKARSD